MKRTEIPVWISLLCAMLTPVLLHSQYSESVPLYLHNTYSYDTRLADLDGDGDMDMYSGFGWYENTGMGEFAPERLFWDVLEYPYVYETVMFQDLSDFTHSDLDLDGDEDIVISFSLGSNGIGWFENLGNMNFAPLQWFESASNKVYQLKNIDIDEDGDDDLIYYSYSGAYWIENLSGGAFSVQEAIHPSYEGYYFDYGDLNNDGQKELVFGSGDPDGDPSGFAYFNFSDGEFGDPLFVPIAGITDFKVVLYDFNIDGQLDLVAKDGTAIYVSQNQGGFNFQAAQLQVYSTNPYAMDLADLDSDGDTEIILGEVVNAVDRQIVIQWNWGGGSYFEQSFPFYGNNLAGGARNIDVYDLDEDGDLDIFAPLFPGISNLLPAIDPPFQFYDVAEIKELSNIVYGTSEIVMADFESDGFPEILALASMYNDDSKGRVLAFNNYGGEYGYFHGTGNELLNPSYVTGGTLRYGDVNGDGIGDMVTSSFTLNSVKIAFGTTQGKFPPSVSETGLTDIDDIGIADMDNDGFADVVFSGSLGEIYILRHDGANVFLDTELITDAHVGQTYFEIGNLDGDIYPDLISYSQEDGQLAIILNTGEGLSYTHTPLDFTLDANSGLALGDLDGDGDLDLVTCSTTDGQIAYYLNESGSFTSQVTVETQSPDPSQIGLSDIDSDGDLDFYFISESLERFSWIENQGSLLFSGELLISQSDGIPRCQTFADIDNDGDLDWLHGSGNCTFIGRKEGILGCTDPTACNYNPEATLSSNDCCYGICGCTDPNAFNYGGECEDGSCEYVLYGYVFHDANENNFWDLDEEALPDQEVELMITDVISQTDENGMFLFHVQPGLYNIKLHPSEEYPGWAGNLIRSVLVTPETLSEIVEYAVHPIPIIQSVSVSHSFGASQYLCDSEIPHQIVIHNGGNVPIQGIVKVAIDEDFQSYELVTPVDSIVNDTLYYSYSLFNPQSVSIHINLTTPPADLLGEYLYLSSEVFIDDNGSYVFGDSRYNNTEVTCSYDPNDKQSFPHGYAEPRFILNDELVYRIRFQNTGNAPAQLVVVRDTLDVGLDWNSFELETFSHAVVVNRDEENRLIEFIFNDIMLPDSTCCGEESEGFVQFRVLPEPDLPVGYQINNTAYIFFDSNLPIVTNTNFNTIYECLNSLATIQGTPEGCDNVLVELSNDGEYIESYSWLLDSLEISSTAYLSQTLDAGTYQISLEVSNPICWAADTVEVLIYESPEASFTQSSGLLTASEGDGFQWFFNGLPIDGETGQSMVATQDGNYSVEISTLSGCTSLSEEQLVIVTSVMNDAVPQSLVYPNPASDHLIIAAGFGQINHIEIVSLEGKQLMSKSYNEAQDHVIVNVSALESGMYLVRVENGAGLDKSISRFVKK
ncbi:MAG: VCBS repeat-containing protein [Flavobacteriales bacterium]|nr:VCBS repeat-containing protein [Flavobacteriales bacterium]